jgi:DNA invertase Pin-like site-specific DNA recombinase
MPEPAAYLRTGEYDLDGAPDLDEQRRHIRRHVRAHDASGDALDRLTWHVDEKARGTDLDRLGLRRLVTRVQSGDVSVVLVHRANRLSTRLRDVLRILERYFEPADTRLVSVTERFDTGTDRGRRVLSMLRSFSELGAEPPDKAADREKAAAGRRRAAEAGAHAAGRVPYGYRRTERGALQPDPDQAQVVRRIFRLRDDGASLRAIAQALTDDGVPAPSGGPWQASTVRYLLHNETYYGYRTYELGGDTITQDVPHLQIVEGGPSDD